MNNKISAIIIAKNEEPMISDCIKSLSFCDEIIVVNNESTDKTEDVARKLNATVINSSAKDFSELRNEGLGKARGEWVLYVDADERVSELLKKEILNAVTNNTYSTYKINRKNFYFGNHPWPQDEKLERLFKKSDLKKWYGKLHESPDFKGKEAQLGEDLYHYSHKDLSSMLNKTIAWSDTEARLRFDAHHPKMAPWRFLRVMITAFLRSYIKEGGWRAGTAGIIESMYQSFSMFITYAKLWEMQENAKSK